MVTGEPVPVRLIVVEKKGTIFYCKAAKDPEMKGFNEAWERITVKFSVSDLVFPEGVEDRHKPGMCPEEGTIVFAAKFESLEDGVLCAKRVALREHQV